MTGFEVEIHATAPARARQKVDAGLAAFERAQLIAF
jgi:hypothetical protein